MATVALLLRKIEAMTEREKQVALDDWQNLPLSRVSCRNCALASWRIVDRGLLCLCKDSRMISWSQGISAKQGSVETTDCDEYLKQQMKEMLEPAEAEKEQPVQREIPTTSRQAGAEMH